MGACGSGDDAEVETSGPDGGEPAWTDQALEGEANVDEPVRMAVDGDDVVLVFVDEAGVLSGFAAEGKGRFQGGEPLATGYQYLRLGGVTRFGNGWITLGNVRTEDEGDAEGFEVRAFRSDDGRTWSESEITGLGGAMEVTGLTGVDDVLVAVGMVGPPDETAGSGMVPAAGYSENGQTWTRVPLPGDATGGDDEGQVSAVATSGNQVLAVGSIHGGSALWSSTDQGSSWTLTEAGGIPPRSTLQDIAVQGDVLVASGMWPGGGAENLGGEDDASPLLLRSTDDGRSWHQPSEAPPADRDRSLGWAMSLFAGGQRFFALRHSFVDAWREPELCYADIDLCRRGTEVAVYAGGDGDRWTRIDPPEMGEYEAVEALAATDGGRVVAASQADDGVHAWTWPAGAPLPTTAEPVDPASDVDLLEDDEEPEAGRRYGRPLYIHCGMDWLYVGEEAWERTDNGPGAETGAGDQIPEDWPVAQQTIFGYITLVQENLIEYSIGEGDDVEVIATYAPARSQPPGCD